MPAVRTPAAHTTVRAGDPLGFVAVLDRHAACVDVGDPPALADVHADVASPSAALAEVGSLNAGTTRSPASSRITCAARGIDAPEIALHCVAREDRELAGDLNSGRAAADDDERQPLVPRGGVVRSLGLLEGAEDLVAEVDRIRERLQPGALTSCHSSWPKYDVSPPQARIRLS